MGRRRIVARTAGIVLMIGALTSASDALQASEESDARSSSQQDLPIQGVWLPLVTIADCQTGVVLASFPSQSMFIRGGSLVESNGQQAGLGTWLHAGGRNYTSVYRFLNFNADGSPAGSLAVSARIRVSADGNSFRSSETFEVADVNGNVFLNGCGTREAKRLQ